jgi:hypothetical protein
VLGGHFWSGLQWTEVAKEICFQHDGGVQRVGSSGEYGLRYHLFCGGWEPGCSAAGATSGYDRRRMPSDTAGAAACRHRRRRRRERYHLADAAAVEGMHQKHSVRAEARR